MQCLPKCFSHPFYQVIFKVSLAHLTYNIDYCNPLLCTLPNTDSTHLNIHSHSASKMLIKGCASETSLKDDTKET